MDGQITIQLSANLALAINTFILTRPLLVKQKNNYLRINKKRLNMKQIYLFLAFISQDKSAINWLLSIKRTGFQHTLFLKTSFFAIDSALKQLCSSY